MYGSQRCKLLYEYNLSLILYKLFNIYLKLWKKSGVWFTNSYPITSSNTTIPPVSSNESLFNSDRDYVSGKQLFLFK